MQVSIHAPWAPVAQPSPVGGSRGWSLLRQTRGCTGPDSCSGGLAPALLRPHPVHLGREQWGPMGPPTGNPCPPPRWHGRHLAPQDPALTAWVWVDLFPRLLHPRTYGWSSVRSIPWADICVRGEAEVPGA